MLQIVVFFILLGTLGSLALAPAQAPRDASALQLGPNPRTELLAEESATLLRNAFSIVGASIHAPPPVLLDHRDGGLSAHFRPVLKLLPGAPAGMSWRYAMHPVDNSDWSGWGYFCLEANAPVTAADWLALRQVTATLSPGWAYLGTSCGAAPTPGTISASPAQTPQTWPANSVALSVYPPQPEPPPEGGDVL